MKPTTYLPPRMRAHLEAVLRRVGLIGKRPKAEASAPWLKKQCDATDEMIGRCELAPRHRGRHGRVSNGGYWVSFGEVE